MVQPENFWRGNTVANCNDLKSRLARITVARGTQERALVSWGDGAGGEADLTGYSVEIYDPSVEMPTDVISATFIDAATGQISLLIDDSEGLLPVGVVLSFRLRLMPSLPSQLVQSTFKIEIVAQ